MADIARIRRNVAKMTSMNAPQADIDGYLASEGVTSRDLMTRGERVVDELKHQAEDLTYGARRALSGATLGASEWALRKMGAGDDYLKRREAEGLGTEAQIGGFGAEMLGNIAGAGGAIVKGVGKTGIKGLKALIASGALEGAGYGATQSDTLGELAGNVATGAGVGGASAGAFGMAGKAVKRLVPSLNVIGKKSLNDAFTDRETTIALKRGAKASQKISDDLAQEMPMIKDNINGKMNATLNDIIGETPDIEGMLQNAKQGYADYMVMNAENPVSLDGLRNSYKKYTPFEKKALTDAIKSASFETNSKIGTVEHTHQMRMAIDDAIDSAMKKSNNRNVPSLNKIRKELDDILKTDAGYKAIDDGYAQAMKVKEAYNNGFTATKASKKPTFSNDLERKAWISGVNEKLQNDLVNTDSNYAKSVANNLSILKNGMDSSEFKGLKKAATAINKEYKRASDLDRIVNKESDARKLPFWREVLESIGSAAGATVGSAEKGLYGLSDISTANRILSGRTIPTYSSILNASRITVPSMSAVLTREFLENQ